MEKSSSTIFRKHIALPSDHGSWVFLFCPLLIGLFAGGRWTVASLCLIIAALAAFLLRQPLSIVEKKSQRTSFPSWSTDCVVLVYCLWNDQHSCRYWSDLARFHIYINPGNTRDSGLLLALISHQ